jgi:hypothetical protein
MTRAPAIAVRWTGAVLAALTAAAVAVAYERGLLDPDAPVQS